MVTTSARVRPVGAVVGHLNRIPALGQTLAQVLGGLPRLQ